MKVSKEGFSKRFCSLGMCFFVCLGQVGVFWDAANHPTICLSNRF